MSISDCSFRVFLAFNIHRDDVISRGAKPQSSSNPTAALLTYHVFITTTCWWQSILLEHGTKDHKMHFHSRAKIALVIKIYFLFLFEGYCIGNPLLVAQSQQLAVNWAGELISLCRKRPRILGVWVCKRGPKQGQFFCFSNANGLMMDDPIPLMSIWVLHITTWIFTSS